MDAERMLVVVSPTLSPLSTDVPVPTEGQPEWLRCQDCGTRVAVHEKPRRRECWSDDMHWSGYHRPVRGPYPFTVAVWQEVCICSHPPEGASVSPIEGVNHASGCPIGVVVGMVEVTGPGHHADECRHFNGVGLRDYHCRWDALPDCWHTPTGKVTPIDPIPMERPTEQVEVTKMEDPDPVYMPGRPQTSWWADIDVTTSL